MARTPGPPALVRMVSLGPRGRGCFAEDVGQLEELGDAVDAEDAAAAESGVVDFVAARHGAGVRGGGFGGGFGAAGFDDDDRFAEGNFARGGEEGASVADGFHVEKDALGVVVGAEVGEEIAPADVEHGAGGNDGAEADVFGETPIENGGEERAALAEESDAAGAGDVLGEGGVEAEPRVHDAEAVGADEARGTLAELRLDFFFEGNAFGAFFFEAGGDDNEWL